MNVPGYTSTPAGKVDSFLYSGFAAVTLTLLSVLMKIVVPCLIAAGAALVLNIVVAIGMERPRGGGARKQSRAARAQPDRPDASRGRREKRGLSRLPQPASENTCHNSPNVVLGCTDLPWRKRHRCA